MPCLPRYLAGLHKTRVCAFSFTPRSSTNTTSLLYNTAFTDGTDLGRRIRFFSSLPLSTQLARHSLPSFDMILPSLLVLGVAAALPLSAENYDFSVRCEHGPSSTSTSYAGEPDTGCVNVGAAGTSSCFSSCQALAHDAWQWGAGCKMYVFADRDCGGDYNSVELWTPRPDFEHLAGPAMKLPSEGCVRSYSVHCPFGSVRWPNGVKKGTALVIQ